MIANKIVSGARDDYSCLQEAHLQRSEMFLAATINVRDERSYFDAPRRCGFEFRLDVGAVKSKNCDIDRFFGFLDGGQKGRCAIARLKNEFHRQVAQNDATGTLALISRFVGISLMGSFLDRAPYNAFKAAILF